MPISETQLNDWSSQGAIQNSAKTYNYIKNALGAYRWSAGMQYEVYLQGSYANSTNIRSDSDVDVVVEATSVFYSDLSDAEKQTLGLRTGGYGYADFRKEVIRALNAYCGNCVDTSGANAIAVLPNSGRLKADVLPCVRYKRYNARVVIAEGLTFWNQHTNQQVINYPKLHIRNGELKNANDRSSGWYKPSVRMLKNARRRVINDSDVLRKKFPSYFVESLFYNVPDVVFRRSYQSVFAEVVNYLNVQLQSDQSSKFVTQSGQHWLFGASSVQWNREDARDFVTHLAQLWTTWQSQSYAPVRY
jgi:predicted nucleotidyltransferase